MNAEFSDFKLRYLTVFNDAGRRVKPGMTEELFAMKIKRLYIAIKLTLLNIRPYEKTLE